MSEYSPTLPGFKQTDMELVRSMTQQERVDRAIALLKEHEPRDGYYLAFSGGKDSCVIKKLAQMANVKFEAWYSQTTIDAPELVTFIKECHPDVKWMRPEHGNMMARIQYNGMPTRFVRWCCREYKENGGTGRVCIFGVRAEESNARAVRWKEVSKANNSRLAICPIVYWTTRHVWEFIYGMRLYYCRLYSEGLSRLGCIGCPLKNGTDRLKDFERWPRFRRNWFEACRKYWETHHTQKLCSGKLNFCSQFKTAEEFWQWWMSERTPDVMREECQTGLLWTNQELDESEESHQ